MFGSGLAMPISEALCAIMAVKGGPQGGREASGIRDAYHLGPEPTGLPCDNLSELTT